MVCLLYMAGVSFNEDNQYSRTTRKEKTSLLVSLTYAIGLAKNEREAQYALCGICVVCALAAGYFFFGPPSSHGVKGPRPTPAQLQNMSNLGRH
jgi:hypothetical protein